MPLTREQKRQILQQNGYDPNTSWLEESTGNVFEGQDPNPELPTPQPNFNSSFKPPTEQSTALEAFGRHAQASILPTAASIGAGAGVGALLGGPAAPITATIGGLLAAAGAGFGASALQEKYILSDAFKQKLAQDAASHRVASTLGGLAPSAAVFNPVRGLANLPALGRDVAALPGQITRGVTIPEASIGRLLNAGINVGGQVGIEGARQYSEGQFSPGNLALAGATGLVFSEPYSYARPFLGGSPPFSPELPSNIPPTEAPPTASGFPPRPLSQDISGADFGRMLQAREAAKAPGIREEASNRASYEALRNQISGAQENELANFFRTQNQEEFSQGFRERQLRRQLIEEENRRVSSRVPPDYEVEVGRTGIETSPSTEVDTTQSTILRNLQTRRDAAVRESQARAIEAEANAQRAEAEASEALAQNERRKLDLAVGRKTGIEPEIPAGERLATTLRENQVRPPEVPGEVGPEGQVKYSKESKIKPTEEKFTEEELRQAREISYQQVEPEIGALAQRRGVTVKQSGAPIRDAQGRIIVNEKGEPIAGIARPEKREVEFGPVGSRGGETPAHEIVGHIYVRDLLGSSRPKDVALGQRGQDIFKNSSDPEEALANVLDLALYDRTKVKLYGGVREKFNKWFGDFLANAKEKLGGNLSDDQVIRRLATRGEYDAPYGTRSELLDAQVKPVVAAGAKLSEESKIRPEDVDKLSGKEFVDYVRTLPKNLTDSAYEVGGAVKSTEDVGRLKEYEQKARDASSAAAKSDLDEAMALSYKAQFFREAHEYAEGTGSAGFGERKKNPKFVPPIERIKNATNPQQKQESIQRERPSGNARGETPEASTSDSLQREEGKDYGENEKLSKESKITPADVGESRGIDSFIPAFRSAVDRVRRSTPKEGPIIAKAVDKFFADKQSNSASIFGPAITEIEKLQPSSWEKVRRYLYEVDANKKSNIQLTGSEAAAARALQAILKNFGERLKREGPKIRDKAGFYRNIVLREGEYFPNVVAEEVVNTWLRHPTSEAAKRFDKLWLDHAVAKGDVSVAEAKKLLTDYKKGFSFRGRQATSNLNFGAIRKAEGFGLPFELTEPSLPRTFERYANRAGSDLSYFQNIQNNPEARASLGLKDQFGEQTPVAGVEDRSTIPEVQDLMESVYGVNDYQHNPGVVTAARTLGALIMGPGTAARNLASVPAQVSPYIRLSQIGDVAKALGQVGSRWQEAKNRGLVKSSYRSQDTGFDTPGDVNRVLKTINSVADFFRKYQGRDLSDNLEGAIFYSIGKELGISNYAIGDKSAKEFLARFNRGKTENLTEADFRSIGQEFATAARTSYDPRQLPPWALRGQLAPFFQLSRFAIAKSNVIAKDVIAPALKGNYGPLLKYIGTSLGVGLGIEQLNELISNRKPGDATTKEVLAEGDDTDRAEKVIDLLQLASFSGIMSDIAKLGFRAYQGKDLAFASPASFPLYTWLSDTMAGNIGNAVSAIKQGEDPLDVLPQLVSQISRQTIQGYRYADNWINTEESKRKDIFRDKRVFEELAGYRDPEATGQSNEFENLTAKKFRRTGDIGEAVGLLPELISKAVSKANGDPYRLLSELRKLKQNNYQTLPSPKTMPLEFARYVAYLSKTQGAEEASERVVDYFRQNAINKAKSSLVP